MKKLIVIAGLFVGLALSAAGEQGKNASPNKLAEGAVSESTKISPAKEADIRRLLEMSGAKELSKQMMDSMGENIKPMLTRSLPAGTYREKLVDLFFVRFKEKADTQKLIDMAVPLYDKYLTHDEIKGLLQFYSTPLGQKALNILPKLTTEMQKQGSAWGEQLGRESMMEVLEEHPDLRAELEQAAKQAQGK